MRISFFWCPRYVCFCQRGPFSDNFFGKKKPRYLVVIFSTQLTMSIHFCFRLFYVRKSWHRGVKKIPKASLKKWTKKKKRKFWFLNPAWKRVARVNETLPRNTAERYGKIRTNGTKERDGRDKTRPVFQQWSGGHAPSRKRRNVTAAAVGRTRSWRHPTVSVVRRPANRLNSETNRDKLSLVYTPAEPPGIYTGSTNLSYQRCQGASVPNSPYGEPRQKNCDALSTSLLLCPPTW